MPFCIATNVFITFCKILQCDVKKIDSNCLATFDRGDDCVKIFIAEKSHEIEFDGFP